MDTRTCKKALFSANSRVWKGKKKKNKKEALQASEEPVGTWPAARVVRASEVLPYRN